MHGITFKAPLSNKQCNKMFLNLMWIVIICLKQKHKFDYALFIHAYMEYNPRNYSLEKDFGTWNSYVFKDY